MCAVFGVPIEIEKVFTILEMIHNQFDETIISIENYEIIGWMIQQQRGSIGGFLANRISPISEAYIFCCCKSLIGQCGLLEESQA